MAESTETIAMPASARRVGICGAVLVDVYDEVGNDQEYRSMAKTALSFATVKLEDRILGNGGNTYNSGPSSDVMGAHILAAHHYMSSNGYRARMERPCTTSRASFLLGVTTMTQW
jgi:hypothetical protein